MQQVNLYTEEFRPQKIVLPLPQMLWAVAGSVTILVFLTIWMSSSQSNKEKELHRIQGKLENIQAQVTSNEAKVAMMKQDESLVRNNLRLTRQVEGRTALLETLDSVAVRETSGFSPYLIGLARHTEKSLWLTHFRISGGGEYMRLEGLATSAQAVPAYLERLSQEPVFVGKNFSEFLLDARNEKQTHLQFSLETKSTSTPEILLAEAPMPATRQVIREVGNER